jgi:cyclopropane fatty-acyl-phospholipid synthase-like methyltransferase
MNSESVSSIRKYYDQKTHEVPSGTGLVWYMGQDQLHPPMIDDENVWNSRQGWIEGAKQTVKNLVKLLGIKKEHAVLDVGSGVGGIGRTVVEETGAKVVELNLSKTQLLTGKLLSDKGLNPVYGRLSHLQANGLEVPIADNSVDRIISVNMFYHFPNMKRAVHEFFRVLKKGGKAGIDDWFLTRKASAETKERLRKEWSSPEGFHEFDDLTRECERAGFEIEEKIDLTEAGRKFINQDHFGKAFDRDVAPIVIDKFPQIYQYDAYKPEYAKQAAQELKGAVMLMGDLYRNGEAVYKQLVVKKK